jgi:hypothetical protein
MSAHFGNSPGLKNELKKPRPSIGRAFLVCTPTSVSDRGLISHAPEGINMRGLLPR